ncbi:uncharacterized protein RAG0_05032 [Rhynchosporium agropyri]|uniref:Uncharacterized protein n=1 Tax=Rhynchosporium agropyri TaxID=914238 RepID=A0A1E1KBC7_9HELO|nr:uncharacterized protein RAG0_05032 [Rhynchosporium agropyri]
MTFRTTANRLHIDANASAKVQQTTAVLPLQYDSLIALVDLGRRAPQDPLSHVHPPSRIKIQIEIVAEGVPAGALGTFQYFSTILNRHAQQLRDSTRALCRLAERSNQVLNALKAKTPTPKSIVPPGIGIGPPQRSSENATVRNFVYGGREVHSQRKASLKITNNSTFVASICQICVLRA